ncbi:MAG: class I SAM-dependent methyltransferase [Lachnospiraceae bacterium]|jgi:SAM-dependent methyltransferase|nr:class I SAM-dependent methyltransferase [Lachnospiraceae bacterium]MEE3460778.1 class I SAM-dependent methyltransferase [Lachnospiraceae bacterium]
MLEMYGGFAHVYDEFMDNIPYDEWTGYLHGLLVENGVEKGTILDLACGTGNVTKRLKDLGYDMIGLDQSEDMLEEAYDKCPGTLFLCQDMREMDLYGTVDAIVCICDGMNYMLTEDDFVKVLRKADNFLEARGLFIFDLKTEHYYRDILGNRTMTDNREDASYIWENEYDEEAHENRYLLTTYEQRSPENENLFVRTDEYHVQHAFAADDIIRMVRKSGMELVGLYDAFTHDKAKADSERIYCIARETYQKGKYYTS